MKEEEWILTEADFAPAPMDTGEREKRVRPSLGFWQEAYQQLRRDPVTLLCLALLLFMFFGAVFFPMLSPFDYAEQNAAFGNKPCLSENPVNGAMHWFGTDNLGRDNFVRMWYGARISLTIAVAVAVIDCAIGVIYGGLSGYFGGKVDMVLMRLLEVISGIPYLIVVLLLVAVLPRGMLTLIIAYSITGWTGMARLVRGQVLSLKNQEFMIAARMMGASALHILGRHVVPNLLGLILVNITLDIPGVIFTEAFLSMLGLGVAPPYPSWGIMANIGIAVFRTQPMQLVIPATFICLTMLAFNLLGDRLQDAFDPKGRRSLSLGRGIKNRKPKNQL